MGRRIREFDWSTTPLGPPEHWPPSLRGALGICLQSNFPTAVYWGPELRLLYNDAWIAVAGAKHPAALGMPAEQVWTDIWPVVAPHFRAVVSERRGYSAFDQMLPMERAGRIEETYWNYSLTPILDRDGHAAGIFNQGHETTTGVIAGRLRKAELARMRDLFQQAPVPVVVLRGPDHVFELTNAAYLELIGGREVIGLPVRRALPEVVDQGFIDILDGVYRTGEPYVGHDTVVRLQRCPDGEREERLVDFVYHAATDPDGRVTGIIAIAADVTDRTRAYEALRRSEEELREAGRRKDEFLAMLAHELRNPLAPILSATRLMQIRGDENESLKKAAEICERQVRHMVRLVDDLLEVSRVTRGVIELRMARMDVESLVENAVEAAEPMIAEKRHRLLIELPAHPVRLDGDAVRLSQALLNLLNNAARYTPAGGRISVRVEVVDDCVRLSVEDNGLGIPAESLEKVFELFARGPAAAESSVGGLGIGLHLAREIARLHGGTLYAESPGVGRGSRFVMSLPLPVDQDVDAALDDAPVREGASHRVLVVDDNADAADSLAMNLELHGHTVRTAYDGPAALRCLETFTPQVALLDIGMPGMNGFELASTIRERYEDRHIALVALTGLGQAEDKRRAARAGFQEHLTKPADPAFIHKLVARLARETVPRRP